MSTKELIIQLLDKSNEDIQDVLTILMINKKLSFTDLNKSYVNYLEYTNANKEKALVESNICLCLMMSLAENKETLSETENEAVQRGLYKLNQSKLFNMDSLNKKLNYIGDEKAKLLSSWKESKLTY